MQVVEIAVRFGDALLDHRQLTAGTYRIGTGRDVDLAVPGLTSFPLVDHTERGWMVRVPAGFSATRQEERIDRTRGGAAGGGIELARGDRIELSIGRANIAIELVGREARVPKPRFETGMLRWITGALVAHLIALLVIDLFADPESQAVQVSQVSLLPQLPEPPPPPPADVPQARLMTPRRKATPKPVAPRVAVVEPIEMPAETDPTPAKRRARALDSAATRAIEGARRAGILGGGLTAEDIQKITGTVDLDKALSEVDPVYREHEAEAKGFGGGRRFDPTQRDGWGSVATGRYATVSGGRATGDHYALPGEVAARPIPKVAHCVGACLATGGLARDAVRAAITRHDDAILGCYERSGQSSRGDVVVELSIGEDGKVITADGAGMGSTGSCVAGVIRRVAFPKAAATTVRYPLSFSPS